MKFPGNQYRSPKAHKIEKKRRQLYSEEDAQKLLGRELKRYIKNGRHIFKYTCYATTSFEVEIQANNKEQANERVHEFINTGDSSPVTVKPGDFQLEYYNDGIDSVRYMGDDEVIFNYLDEYFSEYYPELMLKEKTEDVLKGMTVHGKKFITKDDKRRPIRPLTKEESMDINKMIGNWTPTNKKVSTSD